MQSYREAYTVLMHENNRTSTNPTENLKDFSTSVFDSLQNGEFSQDKTETHTQDKESEYLLFLFVFYFIFMGLICLVGFCGNTLSIIVLSRDRSHRVVTFLLKCLAVADNTVLFISFTLLSIMYGLVQYLLGRNGLSSFKAYVFKYGHPIGYMSQTLTVWMTVLLAINRYIAICRPYNASKLCTVRKARIQVFIVVMLTVIVNFPRFFQYDIISKTDGNQTYKHAKATSIGETSIFGIIVTNALFSIIVLVLPLILLLLINIRLIQELQKMRKRSSSIGINIKQNRTENNITAVMVIIIIILLMCHTPDRVTQLLKVTVSEEEKRYPSFTFYFFHASNMLIVLNSASNFFVYYFFRRRFRDIFVATVTCRSWSKTDQNNSTTYETNRVSLQSTPLTKVRLTDMKENKERKCEYKIRGATQN